MKLNPKKCSFSVEEGSFLRHLITKQGIKANPSKVKAITDLKPPMILKEIQSLNWKLAALSRFLSKGANKDKDTEIKKPEVANKALMLENTDGASSFDGSGADLMLVSPEGKEYTYSLRFEFKTTNNEVEYEALLAGLQIANEMEIKDLSIFIDS
ncbi:reverse transcriptase domain-containing protein [Tanacetum coccineum]